MIYIYLQGKTVGGKFIQYLNTSISGYNYLALCDIKIYGKIKYPTYILCHQIKDSYFNDLRLPILKRIDSNLTDCPNLHYIQCNNTENTFIELRFIDKQFKNQDIEFTATLCLKQ